jgi:hypothetical protein
MTTLHDFDVAATPEMEQFLALVTRRMALSPEEAARSQPDFERALREHTLALERRVHRADLTRLDVDVHGIVLDGVRYRSRREKSVGRYTTLAGVVEVERTTYRQRGGHGGETVAPLELRLGLVDGRWTPAAAEAACAFMASVPSKEAAGLLKAAGSMTPSASHLDRLPKRVNDVWEADRQRLEAEIRVAAGSELPDPADVALIVLSLDGIMLPMKDAPRTPGAGKQDQGPKGHREVSCATVSLYDVAGERLRTIRFGRMPEAYKRTLHRQMFSEIEAMRALYPAAQLQAVADGARENWRIVQELADELSCEVTETLDYFHAVEHLTDGLRAAGVPDDELSGWRDVLRDAPDGVERIIEELAFRSSQTGRTAVEKELNYFLNNSHRVEYAKTAAANRPIGSGVQEAACKTLVAERMKRSGMSWRQPGGQGVLTLRSLAQSGRLGLAWRALRPALARPFDVDPDQGRQLPTRVAA